MKFRDDESQPVVSSLLRQGFLPNYEEALEEIDKSEDASKLDSILAVAGVGVGLLSSCGIVALASSIVVVVPAAAVVGCAIAAWNSRSTELSRESEGDFLREFPQIINLIAMKDKQGVKEGRIASAYNQAFKAYRYGDLNDLVKRFEGSAKNSVLMSIPEDKPAKAKASVTRKQVGDHLFAPLPQSQKAEVVAIAKQSPRKAIDHMMALRGITPDELEKELPGAKAALGIQPQPEPRQEVAAIPPEAETQQLNIFESSGEVIEMDLVKQMLSLSQFCHVLLAGENGTGKTTFAIVLLKQIMAKYGSNADFDMLIVDPKFSQWAGLYESSYYQPAFPDSMGQLEKSVDRLEVFYGRLRKRAEERQKTGKRSDTPLLVIIDEVNTWLDALAMMDRRIAEENKGLKPDERMPTLQLNQRAKSAILGIARMGREDKIWLWMIGQNPNLEALGLSGASDRANFTVVAVGCGDNQIGLDLSLSNQTMFPNGQRLRPLLEQHQGKPYQLATCSRYPKNLLIMPSSYVSIAAGDIYTKGLATPQQAEGDDPWEEAEAKPATQNPQDILAKLESAGISLQDISTLLKAIAPNV